MDVFGGAWEGYVDKLAQGLSILQPEDTLVIAGDISWGHEFGGGRGGFYLAGCPAGDQDPHEGQPRLLVEHGLENESPFSRRKGSLPCAFSTTTATSTGRPPCAGPEGGSTRRTSQGQSQKVFHRELQRLETSSKASIISEKLCFLHYPPCYTGYCCQPILDLLTAYGVKACYYGHLHGASHRLALQGNRMGWITTWWRRIISVFTRKKS